MMREDAKAWLAEQFPGDAVTVRLIWDEYLSASAASAAKLAEARVARAAEDYPLLDRLAHALKGNALMVGDRASAEAALALRAAAKASEGAIADMALARLAALDAENRA